MKAALPHYQGTGLRFLSIDVQESPDTVREFAASNGLDWTLLLDTDGSVTDRYFVSGVPEHIFIDRDGTISAIQAGRINETDLTRYLDAITSD